MGHGMILVRAAQTDDAIHEHPPEYVGLAPAALLFEQIEVLHLGALIRDAAGLSFDSGLDLKGTEAAETITNKAMRPRAADVIIIVSGDYVSNGLSMSSME
ncbi:hypothetical protein CSOJ01_12123 [Colletotrichum sojae]|uniref:Uncharacterized protein n=1 Tax=Colletotrichum sojae TaxID=2175907 RepID=A0A8H6IVL1_9PEZI|nr:hypothetical protein CSOJ01_12123 [Colletotrichum sojae]